MIALPGLDDREIADDAALHDVGLAVELAVLLALGDQRADAGLGEEGRDAGAAGADPLGQRALRVELDLDLAGQELARELLVLADIGADHLLDHVPVEQLAQAPAVDAAIVADHRQALDAARDDGVDQVLGDAAQAEAAGDDRHVVVQQTRQRRRGVTVDLPHQLTSRNSADTRPGNLSTELGRRPPPAPMPPGAAGRNVPSRPGLVKGEQCPACSLIAHMPSRPAQALAIAANTSSATAKPWLAAGTPQ